MPERCTFEGCKAWMASTSAYCKSHENMLRARGELQAASQETLTTPTDPALVAGAIQQLLIKQEITDRLRQSRARQKERDSQGYELPEGRKGLPFKVVPRRRTQDTTIPVDPVTGKMPASIRPENVLRWVRQRDHMDRPTQARVAEFGDYGFEAVRNQDGSLCESRFGLLMQGPPEQAALRSADNTPKGTIMRDTALEYAMDLAESVNNMAGTDVTNVFVDNDHKSERVMYGSGREPVDE